MPAKNTETVRSAAPASLRRLAEICGSAGRYMSIASGPNAVSRPSSSTWAVDADVRLAADPSVNHPPLTLRPDHDDLGSTAPRRCEPRQACPFIWGGSCAAPSPYAARERLFLRLS